MENSSQFQLWSPPVLDLSLDSFSNEIFQEFDKKRTTSTEDDTTTMVNISTNDPLPKQKEIEEVVIQQEVIATNDNIASSSHISSSVTLPQSEREAEEDEDTTSTANLFRRSSTFLKNKLSNHNIQAESSSVRNSISSNVSNLVEDISSSVSRQYPPKPLQYSPVVDPPSDDIKTNNRTSVALGEPEQKPTTRAIISPNIVPKPSPKKRSFFSLRFC